MKKILTILAAITFLAFIPLPTVPTIYCGPYTPSGSITLPSGSHDMVIDAKSFNGGSFHIRLTNCRNIRIIHCKFLNATNRSIWLDGHCNNITVDSNYFEGNWTSMYILNADSNVKFRYNAVKNQAASNNFTSQVIQFNNTSGPGFEASYNNVDIDFGLGLNPNPGLGDSFSLYKSNGTASSPIWIHHNNIRGGGTGVLGNGMAGIVAGDVGGSYQLVENNYLVNTGYVGIQVQGGHDIIVRNNFITSANLPWAALGLGSANFSGLPVYNNEISHNTVNWIFGFSSAVIKPRRDTAWKPASNPRPIGWSTNVVYPASSGLNPSVLPADLWVSCTTPPPLPVVDYVPKINIYIYGNTIIPKIPIITSAPVTTWAVSPAFPAGITLNTSNGVISGTPTVTHAVATYVVTATGPTGSDTVHLTMTINKANLTISANDIGKYYRTPNPTFTVRYSAWLNGDSPASLLTPPVASTTAVFNSLPGRYPITVSGATSNNYNISYVSGWLYVNLPIPFIKYKHYGGIKR